MDIIAARKGDFFIVKNNLAADIAKKLSTLTFEEFELCAAWDTLRKISSQTTEQYAEKHGLNLDILKEFTSLSENVDYKATKDLIFFFERDNNYENFRNTKCLIKQSQDFENDFKFKIPKSNFGFILDSFYMQNKEIPEFITRIGSSIIRRFKTYLVQYNDITQSAHIIPKLTSLPTTFNQQNKIFIYENAYMFYPEDWQTIKKIRIYYKRLRAAKRSSWFGRLQNDESLLNEAIKKICPSPQRENKYKALYKKYVQLYLQHTNYHGPFIYECHKLRNRILIEGRLCKFNSKKLLPEDIFNLMIENERSAHLALMIDRINHYWFDRNSKKLFSLEPCLRILEERNTEDREKLLSNLDFLVNVKLQHWMKTTYSKCYNKIYKQSLNLIDLSPITKVTDEKKEEYRLMRSMMYSLSIYNPAKNKYQIKKLDKYIRLPISLKNQEKTSLSMRYNNLMVRQIKAKEFIKIKYGLSEDLIAQANKIYNKTLSKRY
ncbi:MAG: hypothetical protein J6Y53_03290 [Alphaproteobacteria bacterium]|nr:hypothetical protein [Alphaproteobacteria bacterium]